jgi:hypothetical protein
MFGHYSMHVVDSSIDWARHKKVGSMLWSLVKRASTIIAAERTGFLAIFLTGLSLVNQTIMAISRLALNSKLHFPLFL